MHISRLISFGLCIFALITLGGCQTGEADSAAFQSSNRRLKQAGFDSIQLRDWATARDKFSAAAQQRPDDDEAQYYLGVCELRLGRPSEAQFALERALTLRPNDPKITPRILDHLAEAIFRQNRPDSLRAFVTRTAESRGESRDYLRQAKYLAKIGDLDSAKLAFRKGAYFAPPGDATPYLAVADFYLSIKDKANAATAVRYAAYINPNDPGIARRFRKMGIVPGPSQQLEPPKPELFEHPWSPGVQNIDHRVE